MTDAVSPRTTKEGPWFTTKIDGCGFTARAPKEEP